MKAAVFFILSLLCFDTHATLSESQKAYIRLGWHVPYSDQTIQEVLSTEQNQFVLEDTQYIYDFNYSVWNEPAGKLMWGTFFLIQAADIHSTSEGIKYDCIQEGNPLLPSRPSVLEMMTLKTVVLGTGYSTIGWEKVTKSELMIAILTTSAVVANNYRLLDQARGSCNKL